MLFSILGNILKKPELGQYSLGSGLATSLVESNASLLLTAYTDGGGTIAGGVALGAGNDRVDNRGVISGAVSLGDGDDVFVDYAGSSVSCTST